VHYGENNKTVYFLSTPHAWYNFVYENDHTSKIQAKDHSCSTVIRTFKTKVKYVKIRVFHPTENKNTSYASDMY